MSVAARTRDFDWREHPDAEGLVGRLVREALAAGPAARDLASRLPGETSTHLSEWLDHVGGQVEPAELDAVDTPAPSPRRGCPATRSSRSGSTTPARSPPRTAAVPSSGCR